MGIGGIGFWIRVVWFAISLEVKAKTNKDVAV